MIEHLKVHPRINNKPNINNDANIQNKSILESDDKKNEKYKTPHEIALFIIKLKLPFNTVYYTNFLRFADYLISLKNIKKDKLILD